MGCCFSAQHKDEQQPLLTTVEQEQKLPEANPPRQKISRSIPPPSQATTLIISNTSKTFLPISMERQNNEIDTTQLVKEVRRKTRCLQTKDIFAFPALANNTTATPEADLIFLKNVLRANVAATSEAFAKILPEKAKNLVVKFSELQ
ncbi:hypothetical protein EIN_096960 [Entamoeba invadens IP1]|uniref:Uncharacterized protein n=1 Tax=Entamoeba invadens IP1 TaxID=370355 RepID=A0A0A1U0L3_ENTIV|nr:hypothetical protein EIN_096960 [Entamoeba invadens IP1]ELP87429.1 hypothetical protein EIN_096960 [Entamoeba invadens IP1]|eukprot:XP_004254200.1 hypothetical protein EIN_096960 [Entamoeba invadens IP1]